MDAIGSRRRSVGYIRYYSFHQDRLLRAIIPGHLRPDVFCRCLCGSIFSPMPFGGSNGYDYAFLSVRAVLWDS